MDRHCRIGRIRFKSGGELRLLPTTRERNHRETLADINDAVRQLGEDNDDLVGYALVAWSGGGDAFFAAYRNGPGSKLWPIEIPDFAANCLKRHIYKGH